ncbi:MAG: hypothetical protein ACNA7K_02545 [Acholeplasmataceae bacterium]
MNKMTKKLLLSVLTVVLTVIALGTTTFAWFTLTNTATVQPFEAEVVADTGIEVSLNDAENDNIWVTTITTAMIDRYLEVKYPEGVFFNAVTSLTGRNMYAFGNYIDALLQNSPQFINIGIQFQSNNATEIIWEEATIIQDPAQSNDWITDVGFIPTTGVAVAGGDTLNIDASNGMRISADDGASNIFVYEKGGVALGTNATPGGNTVLGGLTNASVTVDAFGVFGGNTALVNGAISYYYEKTAELPTGANDITVAQTFTDFAGAIPGDANTTVVNQRTILTLTPGGVASATATYSGTLVIRIWLEGWDPDTYNALLARTLRATLRFTSPE